MVLWSDRRPCLVCVLCRAVLTAPHVACNAVHVPAERADDAPDPPPERTEDLVRGVRAPVAAPARLPAADAAARREDQRRLRLERRQVGAPSPSPSGRSLSTRADRAPFSFSVSVAVSVAFSVSVSVSRSTLLASSNHPLSHLMQNVFGMHDRARFNVFLYTTSPWDGTAYRPRIAGMVENFVDVSAWSLEAIVGHIKQQDIHIRA